MRKTPLYSHESQIVANNIQNHDLSRDNESLVNEMMIEERCIGNLSEKSDFKMGEFHREYFKELYRFRELFYFLAWRDVVVRYKQTALGIVWALVRPLLTMIVITFVFGKIAHLATESIPYPLFVLSGILPWTLFTGSLVDTSLSLVLNAQLISKIYFPRIVLPASDIVVHFMDFLISFALLLILLFFLYPHVHLSLLALPLMIFLTLLLCLGCGLWLSAASLRFHDFRFIVPFIVQFGIFLSPVGYSSFMLTGTLKWIYFLNPMAGIIEGFRFCLFGIYHSELPLALCLSSIVNVILLITGFCFFRKMERVCADIV